MQVDEGKKDEKEGGNAAPHQACIFPWALGWAYRKGAIGYEIEKNQKESLKHGSHEGPLAWRTTH